MKILWNGFNISLSVFIQMRTALLNLSVFLAKALKQLGVYRQKF